MRKLRDLLKKFKAEETGGGILVATPFFCVIFIVLTALILTVGMWAQRKQTMQIAADCASRAGTLAIDKQYAVLENRSNPTYHVYTELDQYGAMSNAGAVLNAFEDEGMFKGIEVDEVYYNPAGNEFKAPEWSSRDQKYYDKSLSAWKQYYNGDFTVLIKSRITGVWEDLLGLSNNHPLTTYSQSIATGTARRR